MPAPGELAQWLLLSNVGALVCGYAAVWCRWRTARRYGVQESRTPGDWLGRMARSAARRPLRTLASDRAREAPRTALRSLVRRVARGPAEGVADGAEQVEQLVGDRDVRAGQHDVQHTVGTTGATGVD